MTGPTIANLLSYIQTNHDRHERQKETARWTQPTLYFMDLT